MHQETFEKCMLIRARKRDNRKTYRAGESSGAEKLEIEKIVAFLENLRRHNFVLRLSDL